MNTKNFTQYITLLISLLLIVKASDAQTQTATPNIKIKDFTVGVSEKKVNLKWSTDNSTPTNYFEVQKSTDGANYRTILLVLGADPKQLNCDCYGCTDKFIGKASRQSFYRLVHVSPDGIMQVSEAKQIAEVNQLAKK
jgi:hypothetical protein